ncbi:hypothetical protein EMCRGX_G030690 [Ephydatia muelleri]
MDPPSSTVSSSGTGGHADTDSRLPPPPTSENRFSTSPQLFVRSSDVLSKCGPKPPTRRRTRHKVFDARLSSGDSTDGANPPAPGDSLQRLSNLSDGGGNEGGTKPYEEQALKTGVEDVGGRNAVRNGTVAITVQEPEADAKTVHIILTTESEPDRNTTHGSSFTENDVAVSVHPVPTDPQPVMAEEAKSEAVPLDQQLVVVTPGPLEEDDVMPPGEEVVEPEQRSMGDALKAGEEETPQPSVYLVESSSDSDSDVELVTAEYPTERYEQASPPPPDKDEHSTDATEEEPSGPEQAEGSREQPPKEVDQPGEEAPKNDQPGEEAPKNDQPGEEALKNGQPGEEAPKNDQPGDKAALPMGETPNHTAEAPSPPKPPKPATVPGEAVAQGAQFNSPILLPRVAGVPSPSSPTLSVHTVEGGRLSQKKKVPPPIVPMPYTPKAVIPPIPPKKTKPAPPPRAHNTHLSGDPSSLTTMPGREPSPTPPTTTQVIPPAKPAGTEVGVEAPPPGSSPSDTDDRFKNRARVPSPPRDGNDASPVDEAPVHLMSKPEYVHHHDNNRSSTASNSLVSPLSPSPSMLSKVGRRLSVGLIKELAAQEALASYDIISDSNSTEGEGSHSVEEEDIYAIVKACNIATPKKLLVSELPPKLDGFPSDKRSLVIHELYTTEHTYVSRLDVLIEVFKDPLSKILGDEAGSIFGNVDDICAFNKRFLALLYERLCDWSDEKNIGDIFLGMFTQAHKSMYSIYCSNYDSAEVLLNQKMKRKDFELQLQRFFACDLEVLCM